MLYANFNGVFFLYQLEGLYVGQDKAFSPKRCYKVVKKPCILKSFNTVLCVHG